MPNDVKRVRRRKRVKSIYARKRISKASIALYVASLAAGFLLAFLFLTYVPRAYSGWRESRLVKRAHELMQNNDLDGATAAAQQVLAVHPDSVARSEERRVGKERRSRWSPYH